MKPLRRRGKKGESETAERDYLVAVFIWVGLPILGLLVLGIIEVGWWFPLGLFWLPIWMFCWWFVNKLRGPKP